MMKSMMKSAALRLPFVLAAAWLVKINLDGYAEHLDRGNRNFWYDICAKNRHANGSRTSISACLCVSEHMVAWNNAIAREQGVPRPQNIQSQMLRDATIRCDIPAPDR